MDTGKTNGSDWRAGYFGMRVDGGQGRQEKNGDWEKHGARTCRKDWRGRKVKRDRLSKEKKEESEMSGESNGLKH